MVRLVTPQAPLAWSIQFCREGAVKRETDCEVERQHKGLVRTEVCESVKAIEDNERE